MNTVAARVRSTFSVFLMSTLLMSASSLFTPARAALITVEATGVIYDMGQHLSGNGFFSIGDTFSVTYTYDDQTVDQDSNAQYGNYQDAIQSWTVIIGTYVATVTNAATQNAGDIRLWNNNGSGNEWYAAEASQNAQITDSGNVNGHYYSNSDLALSYSIMDVFDSDALIGRTLNLDDFVNMRMSARFIYDVSPFISIRSRVFATITSLTVTGLADPTAVPLPAAAPLMLFGLGAVGFAGVKRRRKLLDQ